MKKRKPLQRLAVVNDVLVTALERKAIMNLSEAVTFILLHPSQAPLVLIVPLQW
tara:strand:- start:585 stop:746 length:162 start_codon:yes stop_codon:yes gene_type:complete